MTSALEREKIQRESSPVNTVVEPWLRSYFRPQKSCTSSDVLSRLVFPKYCACLTHCFAQSEPNFKVVFHIDHTTLCQEFMMPHDILIEENNKQNPKILVKGLKSHDQLTDAKHEIKCSLNKSINTRAVWHVAASYWNHMPCKSSSCILGKKKFDIISR